VLVNGSWITMDDIVKSRPYGWAAPESNRSKTKTYGVAGLGEVGWMGSHRKEGSRMVGKMIVGRTRMTRSDVFRPRRRRILSQSVSSRGYRLKPSGTLYVGTGRSPASASTRSSRIWTSARCSRLG
jgi:hypothetical protein